MSVRAVVFDLDDTLISERDYVYSGFRHVSKVISLKYKLNDKKVFNKLVDLFIDNNKKVFNLLLNFYHIPFEEKDIQFLISEYRGHEPDIHFFNDVIPFINRLNENSIKTGIITDGYKLTQKNKLLALNAYDYFDEIIITDEMGKDFWKPNIKPYELMSQRLKVNFEQMIYIGDNPEKDFYISSLIPIKCIRIHRNHGIYTHNNYLGNCKECYSITSLEQLMKLLTLI